LSIVKGMQPGQAASPGTGPAGTHTAAAANANAKAKGRADAYKQFAQEHVLRPSGPSRAFHGKLAGFTQSKTAAEAAVATAAGAETHSGSIADGGPGAVEAVGEAVGESGSAQSGANSSASGSAVSSLADSTETAAPANTTADSSEARDVSIDIDIADPNDRDYEKDSNRSHSEQDGLFSDVHSDVEEGEAVWLDDK
jgi:hypothetical protein